MRYLLLRISGLILFIGLTYSISGQPSRNYKPSSVCEITSHPSKVTEGSVSIDAELINGMPHGLALVDVRCGRA